MKLAFVPRVTISETKRKLLNGCVHKSISCLNQFELIRKYLCASCFGVMMCACEEEFATRYLGYQIQYGKYSGTQEEVEVRQDFRRICVACRGLLPRHILLRRSQFGRHRLLDIIETIPRFAEWARQVVTFQRPPKVRISSATS